MQSETKQAFEVWPENKDSVELFLCLATQWRLRPDGKPQGLDYSAIERALKLMARSHAPSTFEDLRTMEMAALEVFHE